ncbi:tetratricopeptide repeat protein 37 [Dorcoceras hygrometricum]|uniref:Tetratricopeptide repeat protein 37 n=1 Tax=Dorcoceras hygrometricum TaxID=472368 RepID=A0A2Z7C357_9LAMI|nr:tetratricopeptide repeat protein 37 [Dorcoceras hygrometricum]
MYNLGAFGWGAVLLEEASAAATHGTSLAGNISCLWKLHGDIQLMYARCFPWTDGGLADEIAFNSSISSWRRTCFLAASHASHSYQRALHLTPWKANIYTDFAIASDLVSSLKVNSEEVQPSWPLAEKMCLGSILLEGHNEEFWVAVGCLSDHIALKQHAFIRGLQLDISLAVAWAYIGKLYRQEGELQLAQEAFDRARSIDPSLALPWAGMSADAETRNLNENEAYECCLQAVKIYPLLIDQLAEFQIGLSKLALYSGQLSSSEVFGAIKQALLRAPEYPESHNLNGLVCESRHDYENAITAYKLARCALKSFAAESAERCQKDISINLARSLCLAGNAEDAVEECEYLRQKGQLSHEGLHIYALCLWKLSKYDMALSITRELGSRILSMEKNMAAASISFICRLLYSISGQESAITSILKMPKEFFDSSKISFIVSAMHVLDQEDRLESIVSISRASVTSHEEIIAMHHLIALGKLARLIQFMDNRNLLSYLLLSSKEWRDLDLATRCSVIDLSDHRDKDEGMKSACEIVGAGTVACYDSKGGNENFVAASCRHQLPFQSGIIKLMQKFLHQEPWNFNARYLLTVNYLQKARESKFLPHICRVLARLTSVALSHQLYLSKYMCLQYQYFQLLLCSAELKLQQGNTGECVENARSALGISVDNSCLFFAHLLLCRAYAAENDTVNMSKEYKRCLELKTDFHIGWVCLKFIESRYKLQNDLGISHLSFEDCFKDTEVSQNMWMGGICLELARQKFELHYVSRAIRSLKRAKEISPGPSPIISLLLAQAEASLGSKAKWENNLRDEWLSWPSANESFEKIASIGLLPNMILYLTRVYHFDVASATGILFIWSAISNFLPILGAFISDSYLGRYIVISVATLISFTGLVVLWLPTMIQDLRPPQCDQISGYCINPKPGQVAVLFMAFALMSIGAGGIRPCSMAFGADQFDNPGNPNNSRVLQSFFNWYYASVGISLMIAVTVIVYIQNTFGWIVGFGVPVGLMLFSGIMFFLGSRFYVMVKPNKSLLTGLFQVVVASWKNRKLSDVGGCSYYYSRGSKLVQPTDSLRYLNKACIIRDSEKDTNTDGSATNPWKLCTVQQVEMLKVVIKLVPIWSAGIMIAVTISQHTFPVLQASTMDRRLFRNFKIPPGSFSIFGILTLTAWITFYDRILVPHLSKYTSNPRGIEVKQRIGIGLFISCMGTAAAAMVERTRRARAIEEGLLETPRAQVNMTAMWLIPQHCLAGLGEAFNAIGQIELYYSQFPNSMGSITVSLFSLALAVGNLVGSLIVTIVDAATKTGGRESWVSNNLNKGHYDYYYWILTILSATNFLYYLVCSRAYKCCENDKIWEQNTEEEANPRAIVNKEAATIDMPKSKDSSSSLYLSTEQSYTC